MELLGKVERFTTAVRDAQRAGGTSAAGRTAALRATAMVRYRIFRFREWRFDRRLGIETRGYTDLGADATDSAVYHDGLRYEPTWPADFKRLARSLPLTTPAVGYTFVDLGCGKGRTLALATLHGFGRVVGVELDPRLAEVARANLRTLRGRTCSPARGIEVRCEDAARYAIPLEPIVLYLYNPFGEQTMAAVARNVQWSFDQRPRPMIVVYHNAVHRQVLARVPALQPVPGPPRFWSVFTADPTGAATGPGAT
jgi:SAM-dependent methyltransferase